MGEGEAPQPADIDSQRIVWHVHDSTTRHDRILLLALEVLEILRAPRQKHGALGRSAVHTPSRVDTAAW